MAVTQHASGTQTATIGTEHFLGTDPDTTAGPFQFGVELVNMVAGDRMELRVYEKPTGSADTARQAHMYPFGHDNVDLLFLSDWLGFLHGWRYSLKQTAGTGRAFKWTIRKG